MFTWLKKLYENLVGILKDWEFSSDENVSAITSKDDDFSLINRDAMFKFIINDANIERTEFYHLDHILYSSQHNDFLDYTNPGSFWYISSLSPLSHDILDLHKLSSSGSTDSFSSDFSSSFDSFSSFSSFKD